MQKTKLPSLITIMILTLITVLTWIGFNIYRAINTTSEPSVGADISATLTPSLDSTTMNKIESALFFDKSQIPQITFSANPTASTVPSPTPIKTSIASPSATPVIQ